MVKKSITPDLALQKLRTLCARSEQCTSDILTRLNRWGISTSEAQKIIDILCSERYLDDRRFARAFVRDRYRFARWGRIKIAAALRARQISSEHILSALTDDIDDEEYKAIARDLIFAKKKLLDISEPYEIRIRLFRFAMSRGYESSLISEILHNKDR